MRRGLFFFFLCLLLAGLSHANEYPKAMAVLGDSISEGMLADYSYEKGISTREMFRMIGFASIRDKAEKIQAFRDHYAAHDKVWVSGGSEESLVYSHYERLKEVVPDLISANFAVAGSESFQLEPQVDALLRFEDENSLSFDYITLMIGGNDLKQDKLEQIPTPMTYLGNIETQLRRVLDTRDQAWVLIVGIPQIFQIFEDTKNLVVARLLGRTYTCDQLRNQIYGESVIFEDRDRDIVKRLHEIFNAYNNGMRSLVERLSVEYSHIQMKMVQPIHSAQNPSKVIAVDCFHPSEFGQAEIAELTWLDGFWPDLQPQLPSLGLAKFSGE